ncbi:hypothetical protein MVLG_01618 [Microbotryum lychnidis-dioicae p1A1 Lamole]|uniref:Uncharacterized protein n=1 Tax=Microbotryum lychnidis-dioicae (strain p1A1 Lamole / MvSl-1064) TaxID=683840 RepID=U5H2N4_USTV1|nr:hypothetical protein MVLG_01618 [Microbotryum lychnidis-dioicae p1A1 Lamole]|eukprot:KDE08137.1 hypothetical protein MVLG_01618 [Microbotryum lychnidis-dioicae p1A1 Lamole]
MDSQAQRRPQARRAAPSRRAARIPNELELEREPPPLPVPPPPPPPLPSPNYNHNHEPGPSSSPRPASSTALSPSSRSTSFVSLPSPPSTAMLVTIVLLVSTGAVLYVSLQSGLRYPAATRPSTKTGRRKQQNLVKAVAAAQQATRTKSVTTTSQATSASSDIGAGPHMNASNSTTTTTTATTDDLAGGGPTRNQSGDEARISDSEATTEGWIPACVAAVFVLITSSLPWSRIPRVSTPFPVDQIAPSPPQVSNARSEDVGAADRSSLSPPKQRPSQGLPGRKSSNRKGKGGLTLASLSGLTALSPGPSPHRSTFPSVPPTSASEDADTITTPREGKSDGPTPPIITIAASSPKDLEEAGSSSTRGRWPTTRPVLCDASVQTSPILGAIPAEGSVLPNLEDLDVMSEGTSLQLFTPNGLNLHTSFEHTLQLGQRQFGPAPNSDRSSSPIDATVASRADSINFGTAPPSPSTAPTTPATTHSQLRRPRNGAPRSIALESTGTTDYSGSSQGPESSNGAGSAPLSPVHAGPALLTVLDLDARWSRGRDGTSQVSLPGSHKHSINGHTDSTHTTTSFSPNDRRPPPLSRSMSSPSTPSSETRRAAGGSKSSSHRKSPSVVNGAGRQLRLDDPYWKTGQTGQMDLAIDGSSAGMATRGPLFRLPSEIVHHDSPKLAREDAGGGLGGYCGPNTTTNRLDYASSSEWASPHSSPAPKRSQLSRSAQQNASASEYWEAADGRWPQNVIASGLASSGGQASAPPGQNQHFGSNGGATQLETQAAASRHPAGSFGFSPITPSQATTSFYPPGFHLIADHNNYGVAVHPSPLSSPSMLQSMAQQQQQQQMHQQIQQQMQQQMQQLHAQQTFQQAQAQAQHVLALEAQVHQLSLRHQQLSQIERARLEAEQHQQHRSILLAQAMVDGSLCQTASTTSNTASADQMHAPTLHSGAAAAAATPKPPVDALVYPISSSSNGSDWTPPLIGSATSTAFPSSSLLLSPTSTFPSTSVGAYPASLSAAPAFSNGLAYSMPHLFNAQTVASMSVLSASIQHQQLRSVLPPPSIPQRPNNQRRMSAGRNGNDRNRSTSNAAALSAFAFSNTDRSSLEWQEAFKSKVKAVEMDAERTAKELEIARWRLIVLEEEQHNLEVENQEALRALANRAMRAEARLKAIDNSRHEASSTSESGSPKAQASSLTVTEIGVSASRRKYSAEHMGDSQTHPLSYIDLDSVSFGVTPLPSTHSSRPPLSNECRRSSRRTSDPSLPGKQQRRSSQNSRRRSTATFPNTHQADAAAADPDDDDDLVIVLNTPTRSHRLVSRPDQASYPTALASSSSKGGAESYREGESLTLIDEDQVSSIDADDFGGPRTRASSIVETISGPGYIGSLPTFLSPRWAPPGGTLSLTPNPGGSGKESPNLGSNSDSSFDISPRCRIEALPEEPSPPQLDHQQSTTNSSPPLCTQDASDVRPSKLNVPDGAVKDQTIGQLAHPRAFIERHDSSERTPRVGAGDPAFSAVPDAIVEDRPTGD